MADKINRITNTIPRSSKINKTSEVNLNSISSIKNIQKTSAASRVSSVQRSTISISAADQAKMFQMVEEEASKMFEGQNISNQKQETIKNSVKRTISASEIDEDE
ncbi:MAG: hypothetical protein LBE20_05035 [Deltaproteobacteria bacterium]|jgi:hypothetical protein|nr:hypothetical protein [Deltaproteobacteria bacterium]